MNEAILMDFAKNTNCDYFFDKDVLEIGSYNVNGTVRPYVEHCGCKSYTGIDLQPGPGVDTVINLMYYEPGKLFDVVICLSVLEHVYDWKNFVFKMKSLCKKGGLIIFSTCSPGMSYHEFPHDYWRFTIKDGIKMFEGCDILYINKHFKPFFGFLCIVRYNGIAAFQTFNALPSPEPPDYMTKATKLLKELIEKAK